MNVLYFAIWTVAILALSLATYSFGWSGFFMSFLLMILISWVVVVFLNEMEH